MGATTFMTRAQGKTAEEAFRAAKGRAYYEHGHAGYTGTIAEKHDFIVIIPPKEWELLPAKYARELLDNDDPRIDNKWGPAGAVKIGEETWLFFGWASE
jgi:hypothetical protein